MPFSHVPHLVGPRMTCRVDAGRAYGGQRRPALACTYQVLDRIVDVRASPLWGSADQWRSV